MARVWNMVTKCYQITHMAQNFPEGQTLAQNGAKWHKMVQFGTKFPRVTQNGTKLYRVALHCRELKRAAEHGTSIHRVAQLGTKVPLSCTTWHSMALVAQNGTELHNVTQKAQNCAEWQNMVKIALSGTPWHKTTHIGIMLHRVAQHGTKFAQVRTKYLQYSCEASDFGQKRGDTIQNFVKTESFRPRKTSQNTVNFR
jgi:hypothetical protein